MGIGKSIFVLFFCCIFCFSSQAKFRNMHNFYYEVHINLQEKTNLTKILSSFISESDLAAIISDLRLVKEQGKKVHHIQILKERLNDAVEILNKKAHSFGFFNSRVHYKIEQISKDKLRVNVDVMPGKIFKLALLVENEDDKTFPKIEEKLKRHASHMKASLKNMTELAQLTITSLQEIGFFRPKLTTQQVHVDYDKRIATLHLVVDTGACVNFGDVRIRSFPGVSEEFIKNRLQWKKGETFNIQRINSTVEILRSTQIFSKVEIRPLKNEIVELKNESIDGEIPIEVVVEEDKKHMVDVSVLYSGMRSMNFEKTSRVKKDLKSIITRVGWTRFNAFGGGEQLRLAIEGTPLKSSSKRADYAFEVTLMKPDVWIVDNTANYEVSRRQELTNAYFRKIDKYEVMFSYPLLKNITVRAGTYVSSVYVDAEDVLHLDKDDDKRYKSLTIPVECIIDRTDNPLNPTQGYRLGIKLSPTFFRGLFLHNLVRSEENFSYNFPIDKAHKNVLAINLTHKMLLNANLERLPMDQRIYCGGINSVRGYANQMATELYDKVDCPAGGKSAFEFNMEARRRFNKDFGGVLFFDGAKTFQNDLKMFYTEEKKENDELKEKLSIKNKRWFLSFGAGVRYFTSIGPIRFDFAFPIHRRKNVDSKMQFIMSLGQTF